jgi:hypothetical protein
MFAISPVEIVQLSGLQEMIRADEAQDTASSDLHVLRRMSIAAFATARLQGGNQLFQHSAKSTAIGTCAEMNNATLVHPLDIC